jgi:hypothetical protein
LLLALRPEKLARLSGIPMDTRVLLPGNHSAIR